MSSIIDKILLVVRSGRTKKKQLVEIIEQHNSLKNKILGIVINGTSIKLDKVNYNYTYYHY
ncbi:MAG: hypothetical protein ACTSRH_18795 [Promethearchaeota archaeon]